MVNRELQQKKFHEMTLKNLHFQIVQYAIKSEQNTSIAPGKEDELYEIALDVFSDRIIALGGIWPKY